MGEDISQRIFVGCGFTSHDERFAERIVFGFEVVCNLEFTLESIFLIGIIYESSDLYWSQTLFRSTVLIQHCYYLPLTFGEIILRTLIAKPGVNTVANCILRFI